jgi:hypothetical protein
MKNIKKKYKVLNCPAYNPNGGYYDCFWDQLSWCENIDDCFTKKVINECSNIKDEATQNILSKIKVEEVEVTEK